MPAKQKIKLFDTPAQLTYEGQSPNTTGAPILATGYQPKQAGLLTTVSKVGTGILDPFLQATGVDNGFQAQKLADEQNAEAEARFEAHVQEQAAKNYQDWQERNSPKAVADQLEGQIKLQTISKLAQGQPVSEWERSVSGIRASDSTKPDEFALYKEARTQALQKLGGSDFVGLSPEKQASYDAAVTGQYLQLKKQFGLESADDRLERARQTLSQNGYVATDETIQTFLKRNPNF